MSQSRYANHSSMPASSPPAGESGVRTRDHICVLGRVSAPNLTLNTTAAEDRGTRGEAAGAMRCAEDAWQDICHSIIPRPEVRERLGAWRGSQLQHMLLAAASVLSGKYIPDGISALILWVSASC